MGKDISRKRDKTLRSWYGNVCAKCLVDGREDGLACMCVTENVIVGNGM
jgi:hypothetical protein